MQSSRDEAITSIDRLIIIDRRIDGLVAAAAAAASDVRFRWKFQFVGPTAAAYGRWGRAITRASSCIRVVSLLLFRLLDNNNNNNGSYTAVVFLLYLPVHNVRALQPCAYSTKDVAESVHGNAAHIYFPN